MAFSFTQDTKHKEPTERRSFPDDLRNTRIIKFGTGDKSITISDQGIWAGADNFEDADWSVDLEGNVTP